MIHISIDSAIARGLWNISMIEYIGHFLFKRIGLQLSWMNEVVCLSFLFQALAFC